MFTFDIIEQYEDSGIIESAVRDCIVPATNSVSHLEVDTDEDSIIAHWKAISLGIIDKDEGRFIKSYYNDELLGYGFGEVKTHEGQDIFYAIGGFYGNINGSRKYAFKADWWVALAEHLKGMGFEQLWFSVRRDSTLESCCKIVDPKLSYTCVFEDDPDTNLAEYKLFKITL